MTPGGIHALRKAAALAHHVHGLRLRLTHDGDYLAEVGHATLTTVAYRLLAACGAEELDTPWCPRRRC